MTVTDLSVRYGAVEALCHVTVAVSAGGLLAIVGSNGAGKSTLARAIMGLVRARGSIMVDGVERIGWRSDAAVRSGCVLVPEGRGIIGSLSVEQNLDLGGYWRSQKSAVRTKQRVWELFPILYGRRRQLGGLLSGGEQQMLAIGRSLLADPKLLILDEPTMGLSPLMTDQVLGIVRGIRASGVSIVLVEQNAVSALQISDRAVVLASGRVVNEGFSQDILANKSLFNQYMM
ncbi:MAG: ABC transporter ATP-binding protein [Candidatus Dormibacteria bacterium]